MIICCDYDPASQSSYERVAAILADCGIECHQTAVTLPSAPAQQLVTANGQGALSALVLAALQQNPRESVFYFGHGRQRPPALLARAQSVVLDRASWALLRGRALCVTACFSASAIGEALRRHGVDLLGYTGTLHVPLEAPWKAAMQKAALAGPVSFLGGSTLGDSKRIGANAYRALADQAYASDNLNDYVLGPFMEENVRGLEVIGNPGRRI